MYTEIIAIHESVTDVENDRLRTATSCTIFPHHSGIFIPVKYHPVNIPAKFYLSWPKGSDEIMKMKKC